MNQKTERTREPALQASDRPICFGDPEMVCPQDVKGFIEPQQECLSCKAMKACLQMGLRMKGILPQPVPEAPAVTSRVTSFFKRWSSQKLAGPDRSDGSR
jgi:hypothetical protein